jgi:hypothetical protein
VLQHNEVLDCFARYGVAHSNTILAVKHELLNSLSNQQKLLDQVNTKLTASDAQQALINSIDQIRHDLSTTSLEHTRRLDEITAAQQIILGEISSRNTRQKCERLLQSLHFPGMEQRKQSIPESAPNTFEWAYDTDSSFYSWLSSDQRLFCVFGKPGAGKSTFIKFLDDDSRTREELSVWRPNSKLIATAHYFSYAGEAMHSSHVGLLRTLLHGIIAMDPILACSLCTQRWQGEDRDLARSWTRQELLACLKNLAHLESSKVLLLIDGLDEYYPHESHRLVVDDLKALLETPKSQDLHFKSSLASLHNCLQRRTKSYTRAVDRGRYPNVCDGGDQLRC